MAKRSLLDSIEVPAPCPKPWDEMIGDEKVRHCLSCDRDIHNISEMTRREAQKLLFQSKEKLCIRMEREPDGRIKTLKKQFHQITHQAPIAAGILTASLILSAATNAQNSQQINEPSKVTVTQSAKSAISKPIISGTVTDINGVVIPDAKIILRDTKNGSISNTVSNFEGFYEFRDLSVSIYEIEVAENNGFKKFNYKDLKVDGDKNLNLKVVLQIAHSLVMGDVSTADSPNLSTEKSPVSNTITGRPIKNLPINGRKMPVLGMFPGAINNSQKNISSKTSQIPFTVYDVNDAVIPKAEVKLINQKTKQEFTLLTDKEGIAKFNSIPQGQYEVKTIARGFVSNVRLVKIKKSIEQNVKVTLNVETLGVFVLVKKP